MSRYAPDACNSSEFRQLAASTRLVDARRSTRASSPVRGRMECVPLFNGCSFPERLPAYMRDVASALLPGRRAQI